MKNYSGIGYETWRLFIFTLGVFMASNISGQFILTLSNGQELKMTFELPQKWQFQTEGTTSPYFWAATESPENKITVNYPYKDWNDVGKLKFLPYPVYYQWKSGTNVFINTINIRTTESEFYKSFTRSFSQDELKNVTTGQTRIAGYQAYYVYYEDHNSTGMNTYISGEPKFQSPEFKINAKYLIQIDKDNQAELLIDSRGDFFHWSNEEGEDLGVLDIPQTEKKELVIAMDEVYNNARSRAKSDIKMLVRSFHAVKKEGDVVIKGKITVPDIHKKYRRESYSLPGVKVSLFNEESLLLNVVADKNGNYKFDGVPEKEDLRIRVELIESEHNPSLFQILYDTESSPVSVITAPFNCTPKGETIKDIEFNSDSKLEINENYKKHISDLALIYAFSFEAHQEAIKVFDINLDFNLPLDIKAFDREYDTPMWKGPLSDGTNKGSDPFLVLPVTSSKSSKELTIDLVSHEIGHAIMADAFGDIFPSDPSSISHAGYINESTCDSWTEGFATFFASLIKRDRYQDQKPSLISISGFPIDIEVNYRATSGIWTKKPVFSREEYAVAGLLWDLIDPINKKDITTMLYDPTLKDPTVTYLSHSKEIPMSDYYDQIQIPVKELWMIISSKDLSGQSPTAKAQGYPYLFDVRQLYSRLDAHNVGSNLTEKGISALDEVFISHGFFEDISSQNFCFDKGEKVGYTGSLSMKLNHLELHNRSGRRSPPPLEDSYIMYDENQINTRSFSVIAKFAAPYEYYTETFEIFANESGKIHFYPVDHYYPVEYTIVPKQIDISAPPLKINNQEWWTKRKQEGQIKYRYDLGSDYGGTKNLSSEAIVTDKEIEDVEESYDQLTPKKSPLKDIILNLLPIVLIGLIIYLFYLQNNKLAFAVVLISVVAYLIINQNLAKDLFSKEAFTLDVYEGLWIVPTGSISTEGPIRVFSSDGHLIGETETGSFSFELTPTSKNQLHGKVTLNDSEAAYDVTYDSDRQRLTFSWDLTPSTWYIEKK